MSSSPASARSVAVHSKSSTNHSGNTKEYSTGPNLSWLIFNYFVFKKFVDLGVPPHQIMEFVAIYEQNAEKPPEEWVKSEFTLEVPMNRWDRIRPKHCAKCKKLFIFGGKKLIKGDMKRAAIKVEYICDSC